MVTGRRRARARARVRRAAYLPFGLNSNRGNRNRLMVAFGGAGRRAGGVSAGRDRETLTSEVTMKFCLDS